MYMSLSRLLNTGIQDLALELIQEVVFYSATSTKYGVQSLSKARLAELRLVCRTFRLAADPLFYSEINFDYVETTNSFNTTQDYLHTLIEGTDHVCRYAKILRFNYIPRARAPRRGEVKPVSSSNLPELHRGCSAESLMKAVVTLQNIRVVHWDLRVDQSMDTIIDGLAELSQLEELHLDFAGYRGTEMPPVLIPFKRFKRLHAIDIGSYNISNLHPSYLNACTGKIRELVKGGSGLSTLRLTMPRRYFDDEPTQNVLHEIYKGVPSPAVPTLRRLRLSGYSLQLDTVTLPHLRNLISLDVSRANIDKESGDDGHFWQALGSHSIRLRDLVVKTVTHGVLQYLETYSGLQSLTCGKDIGANIDPPSDSLDAEELVIQDAQKLSHRLWTVVLPRHKATLVSYMGYNRSETRAPSYMTLTGMRALSKCTNLQDLVFSVSISDDYKCPILKPLVEQVMVLPRIRYVQISNTDRFCEPMGMRPMIVRRMKDHINRIDNMCEREILAAAVKVENFCRKTIDGSYELRMNIKNYSPIVGPDGFVILRRASK